MEDYGLEFNGQCRLAFRSVEGGYGLSIECGAETIAYSPRPLAVQLFVRGVRAWHREGYRHVVRVNEKLVGSGEVQVPGAAIVFEDSFDVEGGQLRMARSVHVRGTVEGAGFLSAFEWRLSGATTEDPWFVPGIWYGRNEHVPSYAIGSPAQREHSDCIVFREDRLPLPLVMHYDERAGRALSLLHLAGKPQTVAADDDDEPLIDARLGFGAFGLYNDGTLAFWFPGTEGDVRYPPMWTLGVGNSQGDSPVDPFSGKSATRQYEGWNLRYHPLQESISYDYVLGTSIWAAPSYLQAMKAAWRQAYAAYGPAEQPVDLAAVERTLLELLARLVVRDGESIGIPTWIDCFTGKPGKLQNSLGTGFVARNLEAAALLLETGHQDGGEDLLRMGRDIVEFWVANGGAGLSHSEYDRPTGEWVDGGRVGERTQIFLRDQSEAHRACLRAWEIERGFGCEYPAWLSWCTSYGEWLRRNQNADGSFYRSYDLDGLPISTDTADSSHVVSFLLDLDRATGEHAYVDAAVGVASYLWDNYHRHGELLGGTLDNPNCYDKEASLLALEAYLRLFERTDDQKWLEAAELAAQVCETWVFCWDIPMPVDDRHGRFFDGATTVGYQLITTGFSAFDVFLSRQVGDFARLAQLTGDAHYAEVGRIVLHNTKNTIQMSDEYGYACPGLQIEHWSMGRGRGFGLNSGWLPWVATGHIVGIREARQFPALGPGAVTTGIGRNRATEQERLRTAPSQSFSEKQPLQITREEHESKLHPARHPRGNRERQDCAWRRVRLYPHQGGADRRGP
ncbi:MAG: hypothetical protein ACJ78Q_13320 [Chloroflexia bacterium]